MTALQERIPGGPELGIFRCSFQRRYERSEPHQQGPSAVEVVLQPHLVTQGSDNSGSVTRLAEESYYPPQSVSGWSPELGVVMAFQELTLITGFMDRTTPSPMATCS